MLKELRVQGFKSLLDVQAAFPRLTVLFGPNTAGKSNLLDAVQALSRVGTSRTLSDALAPPIRGNPIEAFSFPEGGLPALFNQEAPSFLLEATLDIGQDHYQYRYKIEIEINPASGNLGVRDELLTALGKRGDPKGNPSIEKVDDQLRVRRKSKPANPRREPVGLNYSLLSDPRLIGIEYRAIERSRNELREWRTYYLDPRVSMRFACPPKEVHDIGTLGGDIAPFLYRLRAEKPKHFDALKRTLRSLIPSVEDLHIDLDKQRGTLDILVQQHGENYSSRIVSEGTLRVLGLCAIAVNPWSGSLLAFEEPENGVHPRRLELIVDLLTSIAMDQQRQVIVTTHSPLFCDAMLRQAKSHPGDIVLLNVQQGRNGTHITPFGSGHPLFESMEINEGLGSDVEDGVFERLMMRGLLDG